MTNIEKLLKNKDIILEELYEWAETFNPDNMLYNIHNIDENEEEEMYASYQEVKSLVERFEKDECNEEDFEKILFHIDQINDNEMKIRLKE